MISEWNEYTLKDISDGYDHIRVPLSKLDRSERSGIYPYYGASGVIDYLDDYLFDGEYVLISEDGENLRSRKTPIAFKVDGKFWVNNHAHIVKGKKPYLNDLIVYIFQNLNLHPYITGAAQPKLNQRNLYSILFYLPDSEIEQKAITNVLKSLDDKIDLLQRQNQTLEALAQTLFRQWFVEEEGVDWKEGVIPDEFDFTMGLSPPGNTYNENEIGMPMFQGKKDFGFRFPTNRVYTTDPRRFAEKFDTLISVRAPVGAQNMALEKCCIGRGVAAFRYKRDKSYYSYTYYKLRSLMDEIRVFNNEGTVFGSIGKRDFMSLDIIVPPKDLVDDFQSTVNPIDEKIVLNTNQIRTLELLRDALLPKLMSGEVRMQWKR